MGILCNRIVLARLQSLVLPLPRRRTRYNCTGEDPRHNIELGHKGSVYLHGLQLTDLQVAVFLGRADCVEELVADPASESWNIAPRANIDRALHMASRGVRDYLHKTHGAPPPPENELRQLAFYISLALGGQETRCPVVYEVLFRAGAEVRPDWRDDPRRLHGRRVPRAHLRFSPAPTRGAG